MIDFILRLSVIIGSIYPVALHDANGKLSDGGLFFNRSFNFPCESSHPDEHSLSVGEEIIGFLDISKPELRNMLSEDNVDKMFSSVTIVVLSHEDINHDLPVVTALNETITMLICKAREHKVRLLYRLQVSKLVSEVSDDVHLALHVLPLDGVSIHMSSDSLVDQNAEDYVMSVINQVRNIRYDATIIFEYPSLSHSNCSWAWSLLSHLDYIYIPTYVDDDCPSTGFSSKENVSERLLTMSKTVSKYGNGMSQLILGVAMYGLDFDCIAVTNGHCNISNVCPNRITPRTLLSSYLAPTVVTTGQYLRFIDFENDVWSMMDLKATNGLGGFGLYRLNDLNWSETLFWKNLSARKVTGGGLYHHDGSMIIVFIAAISLILT